MQLKNAGIAQSLKLLRDKSQRLPSYLVNKVVYSVAIRAARDLPAVSPAQMDAELNASVATGLVRIKSGKRFSRAKSRRRYFFGSLGQSQYEGALGVGTGYKYGAEGQPQRHKPYDAVPLAALIIQAQVNPNSNFNQRTGGVFRRFASPFKGKSRAAGAQAMVDAMRRMLSARHSSGGFFKLCAKVVQQIFRPALDRNPIRAMAFTTGFEALPGGGKVSSKIGKLAGGTVASGIRDDARASFWVTSTEPDAKGKPGDAVYRIAQPIWQQAVDDEAASMREYAESGFKTAAQEAGIKVA